MCLVHVQELGVIWEHGRPQDVIMDMLGNQKTRQLITEYYQSSSEPDLVKRAIKSSRYSSNSNHATNKN